MRQRHRDHITPVLITLHWLAARLIMRQRRRDHIIPVLIALHWLAARLVMRQRHRDHITPVLIALHWLPIRYRIMFKVLVLTFQAVHNLAPVYITDLISVYEPDRQLRSASRSLLTVPRHNLERFGRRCFSVNAPHLWNYLPEHLRLIDSVVLFKRHLKTHLFKVAFICKHVLGFVCLPNDDASFN